jgi:flagellar biosynthesis/type III secretory pathway chaperone
MSRPIPHDTNAAYWLHLLYKSQRIPAELPTDPEALAAVWQRIQHIQHIIKDVNVHYGFINSENMNNLHKFKRLTIESQGLPSSTYNSKQPS